MSRNKFSGMDANVEESSVFGTTMSSFNSKDLGSVFQPDAQNLADVV